MKDVQSHRDIKKVSGNLSVHDFANLYINPRNATMFKLMIEGIVETQVVIVVLDDVINVGRKVFFSNMNAACKEADFYSVTQAASKLDWDVIFGPGWNDDDPDEKKRKKAIMCAEVLIQDRVEPKFLSSIVVPTEASRSRLLKMGVKHYVHVLPGLFFFE